MPYVAPMDIESGSVFAISQRAMAASFTGDAIAVRKNGGSTVNFDTATNNRVDQAAVLTHLDGERGFVPTYFDQSGSGANLNTTNEALQPEWLASDLNGLPTVSLDVDGVPSVTESVATVTFPNGQYTFFAVIRRSAYFRQNASDEKFVHFLVEPDYFEVDSWDGGENDSGASFTGDALDDGQYYIVEGVWEYGTRSYAVNGVPYSTDTVFDAGGQIGSVTITPRLASTQGSGSALAELIAWPHIVSSGQCGAIRQNMAAEYGITLP